MLKEEKTGGKKFMDFGGEILPYAAANNIKVGISSSPGCHGFSLSFVAALPDLLCCRCAL
jgi:hypothetical protein